MTDICPTCRGTGLIDTGQSCHACEDRKAAQAPTRNTRTVCWNCEGWSIGQGPDGCYYCRGTGWIGPKEADDA